MVTNLPRRQAERRLFTSCRFFENYIRSPNVLATFFYGKITYVLISTENGLGYILGDFFHKLIWSPWLGAVASFVSGFRMYVRLLSQVSAHKIKKRGEKNFSLKSENPNQGKFEYTRENIGTNL
jgi:hypothetical protein